MGNHLSNLENRAELSFPHLLNLRNSETEPKELLKYSYFPVDSEGNFTNTSRKIFDWASSTFYFSDPYRPLKLKKYKNEYKKFLLPQPQQIIARSDVTLAHRMTSEIKMFRPVNFSWERFELFQVYPSLEPKNGRVKMVKESDDPKDKKSLDELFVYLERLKKQIYFGFVLNKIETDCLINGFSENPLSAFHDGPLSYLLPEIECDHWLKSFEWTEVIDLNLISFSEILNEHSEELWSKFYMYQKISIMTFRDQNRLDNENLWRDSKESYLQVLKTYISLLLLLIGFLENTSRKLWDRLRLTERELAEFIENSLKP